jgi:hypothetical protein
VAEEVARIVGSEALRNLLYLPATLPSVEVAKSFDRRMTEVSKVQTTTHTAVEER